MPPGGDGLYAEIRRHHDHAADLEQVGARNLFHGTDRYDKMMAIGRHRTASIRAIVSPMIHHGGRLFTHTLL